MAVQGNQNLPKHMKDLLQTDVYETDESDGSYRSRIGSRSRRLSGSIGSNVSRNSKNSKGSKVKSSGKLQIVFFAKFF